MHRRRQIYYLSRTIICLVGLLAIGTLLIPITNPFLIVVDVLLRTYLIFFGTVMAHEAVHGHLGCSKASNFWWGRIALITSMVPFTNFRKTHQLHHAHTLLPEPEPAAFMTSRSIDGLLLRALEVQQHWF